MNAQKYTQKSMEAVQAAQQLTVENSNQQIEQIHLLAALLRQENGLIPQLLRKMGVTVESLDAAVNQELGKLPKVTGSGRARRDQYEALKKYGTDLVEARPSPASSTPSSAATTKSAASSASSRARRRTTPCSSASRASAKPPSRKGLPCASCAATCPKASRTARSFLARHGRADCGRQVPRRI
jgi:ATP-dependent Clp protease ATP-binding subunit ClpA